MLEGRQAPDQILVGASDTSLCILLALSIHLNHGIKCRRISKDGTLFVISKQVATNYLNKVIKEEDFPLFDSLPLGTHSKLKFPLTYARRNGCSRDDVDVRGRWKRLKRIVDT